MTRPRLVCALGALVLTPLTVAAAPILRSADARIAFESPTVCAVDLSLRVDGAGDVEHRVEVAAGARVELVEILGATDVGPAREVGRTRALRLRIEAPTYSLRYRVEQPAGRADRCPLWIPTVPADGLARAVRIAVSIPAGATASGTMPAFTWSGAEGIAVLGHLPAFVRVPFAAPGTPVPWDIALVMDVVSIVTLVGATLAWARTRGLARKGQIARPH